MRKLLFIKKLNEIFDIDGPDYIEVDWDLGEINNYKKELNPFYGKHHTEETKNILSEKHKGKKMSDTFKLNVSLRFKELWKNDEYRKKLCGKLTGRKLSFDVKQKISNSNKNKVFTESHRLAISKSRLGIKMKPFSNEHKNNISKSLKNKKKTLEHINKINKNPEKIKKTAEKHTGMKRSEESKSKMSEAKKGKKPSNYGMKYYYNPVTEEKIMCKEGEQPNGFVRGFLPKRK